MLLHSPDPFRRVVRLEAARHKSPSFSESQACPTFVAVLICSRLRDKCRLCFIDLPQCAHLMEGDLLFRATVNVLAEFGDNLRVRL